MRELRWDDPEQRAQICEIVRQHAAGERPGLTEPLLMRGPARHWPAVQTWSLDHLARRWPKLMCALSPRTLFWFVRQYSQARSRADVEPWPKLACALPLWN